MTSLSVYLSAPMRGMPNENFSLFDGWAKIFHSYGITVHNPVEMSEAINEKYTGQELIRKVFAQDFDVICNHADMVVLLDYDNWRDSKGVTAEVAAANAIGIPTIFAKDLEDMLLEGFTREEVLKAEGTRY